MARSKRPTEEVDFLAVQTQDTARRWRCPSPTRWWWAGPQLRQVPRA
jgi:uncharacterized protein with PIN domain